MQNVVIKKYLPVKGLCGRCSLSEAQNPIPPPPSYSLYTCIQYVHSHREGGREGELNQREG
jgi:hypothetical protein